MAEPDPPLTDAEIEQCDVLYAELKPLALNSARGFVMARTPVRLQDAMLAKIDADFPPPDPPALDDFRRKGDRVENVRLPSGLPADPPVGTLAEPNRA